MAMTNPASPTNTQCVVIALYGIQPTARCGELIYGLALSWFERLGICPDLLGITGTRLSDKMLSFDTQNRKLRQSGFGVIDSYTIVCSADNAHSSEDFFATVHWSCSHKVCVIAVDETYETMDSLLLTCKPFIDVADPQYGIGYFRERRRGPVLFALGVNKGGPIVMTGEAYEQARNISRWSNIGNLNQVYLQGILRDVFRWNLLTEAQLQRDVAGVSLEDWIRADATRGTLTPFTRNMRLWEIEEARVATIRQVLWDACAVFNWRTYKTDTQAQ